MSNNHPPSNSPVGQRPVNDPNLNNPGVPGSGEPGEEEEGEEAAHKFLLFNVVPSWMVSFIAHIALIILLALWFMPVPKPRTVDLNASESPSEQLDSVEMDLTPMDFETDVMETELSEPQETTELEVEPPQIELEEIADFGNLFVEEAFESESMELSNADMANETSNRTGNGRDEAIVKYGGSAASEEAVSLALKWIAAHQLENGSWNFDHRRGGGRHRTSPNPGALDDAPMGATAIALLPFLGRGETHLNGEYKDQIASGLKFLMNNAEKRGRGFSYRDSGTMYSHGLVAIVFCEAYSMTRDPALKPFAQGTIYYIEDAQDKVGGGWRYNEGQAGDTSAVGWQVMALKSGNMCGLNIKNKTFKQTKKFLDDVSTNYGAYYGYTGPPAQGERGSKGRNAVGLLCRMYMGWEKGNQGLTDGMAYIDEKGPDTSGNVNMYYNYYATQAMKHYGGDEWKKWNPRMRDFLVKSQSKAGPTEGSWYFGDGHGPEAGGRLYVTAMCCMTLEVYYRYLPLYSEDAANDEFKFD